MQAFKAHQGFGIAEPASARAFEMQFFLSFPPFLAGEVAERDGRADLGARGADDQHAVHGQEQQRHGVLPSGVEAEGGGRPVRVPVDGGLDGDAARGLVVGARRRAVPQQPRHPRLLEGPADRAQRDLLRGVGGQSLRRGQGAQERQCRRGSGGTAIAGSDSMQVQLVALLAVERHGQWISAGE